MLSSALTEPEPCVPQATDCLWISGLQGRCDTLRYSLPPTLAGGGNAAVQPARMPFYHSPAPPPPQQLLQCPQTPCTLDSEICCPALWGRTVLYGREKVQRPETKASAAQAHVWSWRHGPGMWLAMQQCVLTFLYWPLFWNNLQVCSQPVVHLKS